MTRKSTMVELVQELEKHPGHFLITEMIREAKAGEYHDYKNQKYNCGKVEVSRKLRHTAKMLGSDDLLQLALRVERGEFDEEPDEEDKEEIRGMLKDSGLSREQMKKTFGL